jgi:hypothetical protein
MAERRAVRRTRQQRDDEPAGEADGELTDEAAGEPDDDLAEEPEDELADEPEDELADEPEDELDDQPEDESDDESGRRPRRPSPGSIKPAKAGQLAMRQIAELTGKKPEGVTGVEPGDDGWIVGVEVVEDRRVPSSGDILATYETEVDSEGELVSYHRVKRYLRGRGDSEDF